MFNKNEWIQWAQQSQKNNTEMNDFRNEYWRKNDATKSWMYESTDTNGSGGKTKLYDPDMERPRRREGAVKKIRRSEPFLAGKQAAAWYATDRMLDVVHPGRRKEAEMAKRTSPIRIGTPQSQERRDESIELGEVAPKKPIRTSQVRLALQGEPDLKVKKQQSMKKRLERKSKLPRQHRPGETTMVVRDGRVITIDKGTERPKDVLASSVQHVGNDLQELGAQGWKNVAKGAKVADAASTALTVGSILAAPFTGGLSLAGLGAAAALKGGTKVATTMAAKGATKMAAKQAAKQATKKTLKQKALSGAGRVGTDVATFTAMDKVMGSNKQKPNTIAQTQPNTIQQNTGPIAKIEPSKPQRKLAASYDPEGTELNEILGKVLSRAGRKPAGLAAKMPPRKYASVRTGPGQFGGTQTPIGGKGSVASSAAQAAQAKQVAAVTAQAKQTTKTPWKQLTRKQKLQRAGTATVKHAAPAATTAAAFTLMTPTPKPDTTIQTQSPTGTARDVPPNRRA